MVVTAVGLPCGSMFRDDIICRQNPYEHATDCFSVVQIQV